MEDPIEDSEPKFGNGPRDAFLYLLNFVTLYVSVIGLAVLSWGIIDELMEDPLRPSYSPDTVRIGVAMVLVAFPAFMYLTMSIRRKIASGDMDAGSLLRKILMYFTLFVITITAVIDLITVVYTFLGGELTARTFLKALSIFVIVGLVFGYHLIDLREAKAD